MWSYSSPLLGQRTATLLPRLVAADLAAIESSASGSSAGSARAFVAATARIDSLLSRARAVEQNLAAIAARVEGVSRAVQAHESTAARRAAPVFVANVGDMVAGKVSATAPPPAAATAAASPAPADAR